MNTLPVLPRVGTAITLPDVQLVEAQIAQSIATVTDLETLEEWQARAAALAQYLKGKELHGPMLGAQRRVEARIGQLLGEAHNGGDKKQFPRVETAISPVDRNRFRILARGLDRGLADEEWRSSRKDLIALIQERYPVARRQPEVVVQKDGVIKKSRPERAKEIRDLAASGFRAAQISEKLKLGEEQVRRIAKEEDVVLPDLTIGRTKKLDGKRILSETIAGIDAYVSGLSMLDDVDLPVLEASEISDLMQALSRSINGLRKLRIRMEKEYAGPHTSAA